MSEELPLCPSYRIRQIRQPRTETICNHCNGRGTYKRGETPLICTWYSEQYYPKWLQEQQNMRNESYVRRMNRGEKRT